MRRPYQSAIPWFILAAFTIIWFSFFALTSPQPGGPDVFVFRDAGCNWARGGGLVAGSVVLFRTKITRDPLLADAGARGMEAAFLLMLLATGISGLALLLLRNTAALAVLLPLHLGTPRL